MTETADEGHESKHAPRKNTKRPMFKRIFIGVPLALVALLLVASGYLYAVSPGPIRSPKMEHLHFRMQIIVDGKAVDFGSSTFQKSYAKGQCSGELSEDPIHFHDQKDQFVHIHWARMTGGLVLKNYGWNFIGGQNGSLGYRFDDLPRLKSVPIHGNDLPQAPEGAEYWVYSGDDHGYKKRSLQDFTKQDLETFFNKQSNLPKDTQASLFDWFFPRASAHNGEDHSTTLSEEQLTRLNNLIGNVVIFAQKTEPTDAQIKARFADLEPLSDSTCGG